MGKQVLNLASFNFTGLAGNEIIKVRAIETLREYDVDSCDLPGFYSTIDVHIDLERDIAAFLSTEASIIYSQVADRGTNFAIQKGLQTSCSTVRWFDHYDLNSLEGVLLSATQIDMLVASVSNGLNSSGGFCAGSGIVVDDQRINGTAFVFSTTVPALLAVSASEGINILRNTPSILSTLQENVRAIRAVLDRVEVITIPSHAASPIIHIHLRSAATLSPTPSAKPPNPATPAPRDAPTFDIIGEEHLLQDIVDEALAQGVWITRARRLRGQELVEARPSIRLAVTAGLSRKECERAAGVIKAAVLKVLVKRK
ncbi:pyridoxal phosphate-dependent transferase [Lactarius psammicola]|nr:pyridoxal phosphate-dependent transferase [Lactarius psammicola]